MTTDTIARGLAVGAKAAAARQSLGNELRAAYRNASVSNPLINPWWTAAPAYANSTAYVRGSLVTKTVSGASRLMMQLNTSGTSGASDPTWRTDAVAVTDNTCSWMYVGEPLVSANDANAPTVTTATSNPLGTGNNVLWTPPTYPGVYRIDGGYATTYSTNYWQLWSHNNKASSPNGIGTTVSAVIDDSKFAIGFTNGSSPAGVIIDGRFYSPQVLFPVAGNPNYIVFDFSTVGGRRPRLVTVVPTSLGQFSFAGFVTQLGGTIAAPPARTPAVFIGDSYLAGSSYGPYAAAGFLSNQLGYRMGWSVTTMATGGTGVINQGASSYYTYPARVADAANAAVIAAAKVVVLYGSTNDASSSAAAITAAALQTLQNIRATGFKGLIVWFGPASINKVGTVTIAQSQAVDSALAAAFAQFSDSAGPNLAFYIPFANASLPPITGSYLSTVPSTANSYTTIINTGDGVHPTELGTFVIPRWMGDQIAGLFPSIQ